uniref:Alpha/beta hydrolase n=1 Tax=Coccidioides posadasii RMSCC 3488 TaxID=454284 RepID=A0A0J6F3A3_COCPO|nr:alpha/beta hydrolase [Coccidioides posadasii RMSCC 3488]
MGEKEMSRIFVVTTCQMQSDHTFAGGTHLQPIATNQSWLIINIRYTPFTTTINNHPASPPAVIMNLPSAVSVSITTVPTFSSSQTAENSVMHNRPGFGWSSPHPSHTLLDHPRDLERLAEHLGLDEYGVLGAVTSVCAVRVGQPCWNLHGDIAWFPRPLGGGFNASWQHAWDLSDEKYLELLQQDAPPRSGSKATLSRELEKELEVMRDEHVLRLFLRTSRESFAHGCDPTVQDGRLISTDFGFQVEDIRSDLPVQLWYGKHDSSLPLNHGVQIAARLGGRAHLRVEDESHWSISNNRREEYLEALLSSALRSGLIFQAGSPKEGCKAKWAGKGMLRH